MERPKGRKGGSGRQPESYLVERITNFLKLRDWYVKKTHGGQGQAGFPDLYCCHARYGARWVEVKMPTRSKNPFTAAQLETFGHFAAKNIGVWVLVADTEEEYKKLFKAANWWQYLHIPDASNL